MAALDRVKVGALRILSRHDGTEVLILHGEDRPIGADKRLAQFAIFPSVEMAADVSLRCSKLLEDATFKPDAAGWHAFPETHLKTLVSVARKQLGSSAEQPDLAILSPARRQAWTGERIARLGFLAGLGWTAKKIADDPLIASNANNVYRQAHRFGLALSDGPQGQVTLRLPHASMAVSDRLSAAMGLQRDAYLRRWIITAAADRALAARLDGA